MGAIELRLTGIRTKSVRVNQQKATHSSLSGHLGNGRCVTMTNPPGEVGLAIGRVTLMEQEVDAADFIQLARAWLGIDICDIGQGASRPVKAKAETMLVHAGRHGKGSEFTIPRDLLGSLQRYEFDQAIVAEPFDLTLNVAAVLLSDVDSNQGR